MRSWDSISWRSLVDYSNMKHENHKYFYFRIWIPKMHICHMHKQRQSRYDHSKKGYESISDCRFLNSWVRGVTYKATWSQLRNIQTTVLCYKSFSLLVESFRCAINTSRYARHESGCNTYLSTFSIIKINLQIIVIQI